MSLISCTSKKQIFLNLKECNEELVEDVQIDILKFKMKVDSLYNLDSAIYEKIINQFIADGNETTLFYKFGSIKKGDGSDIKVTNRDSITNTFYNAYRNNINFEACISDDSSAICIAKKRIKAGLDNMITNSDRFILIDFASHIFELKRNHFINEEEYHFLIIFCYGLLCANIEPPSGI